MAKAASKRRKKIEFLDGYQLGETYLVPPDARSGRAGILEGFSPAGDEVIVREWRRKAGDEDLVEIWKHELRQLYRLAGYPGASELICQVAAAGFDKDSYYIVLSPSQRRPLKVFLEGTSSRAAWLRGLSQPQNRIRIWKNVLCIVDGIGILHKEGIVHRNLDEWSILTSAGDEPDFQLTGFEWSLRLSSTTDKKLDDILGDSGVISFARDWHDLAVLIARLFNIEEQRLGDSKIADHRVHEHITATEVRLLRDMRAPGLFDNFNSSQVRQRIKEIVTNLQAFSVANEASWLLVLNLSQTSPLSRTVREASSQEVEIDDKEGQLRWISDDLSPSAMLVSTEHDGRKRYWLKGRELAFELRQFDSRKRTPSWRMAFASNGIPKGQLIKPSEVEVPIRIDALRLFDIGKAHEAFDRVIDKAPDWETLLAAIDSSDKDFSSPADRLVTGFHLLHAIDVAIATILAFPVEVVSHQSPERTIVLRYRPDLPLERLSTALGMEHPAERLAQALAEEELDSSDGWILSESLNIGRTSQSNIELEFAHLSEEATADPLYTFTEQSSVNIPGSKGYLQPLDLVGTFTQLQRRSKALQLLSEHTELVGTLVDPRSRISDTHEQVIKDSSFQGLDLPKQRALEDILSVLPLFTLQGPPGVGKTFLLRDLLERRFRGDQTSRLLVSSQGNHALDHLLHELHTGWQESDEERPLAVRCKSRFNRSPPSDYDIDSVRKKLATGIASSSLISVASGQVEQRLQDCASGAGSGEREGRALEALILRSANIVLATTNSESLATLLDEHAQFDWSIIEEAAKATGSELLSPMMLSHRRLLIGDHKQLPPFGTREVDRLLGDPARLKEIVVSLPSILDRSVAHLLDDEIEVRLGNSVEEMEKTCGQAAQAFSLFKSILLDEMDRQSTGRPGRKTGGALTEQHRMHPAICEVVSKCFYDNKLVTSGQRVDSAKRNESWIGTKDPSKLPSAPIVSLNMPYERTEIGAGRFEHEPRFTNPSECQVVLEAIANLSVQEHRSGLPSLVVLTPYLEQVRLIRREINDSENAKQSLKQFRSVLPDGGWVATVDSFQGNEADVVIFSLVRNNRAATIRRALGFIADERRFNVLLSRARERLIFVGSREFLKTISVPLGLGSGQDAAFLRTFLEVTGKLGDSGQHRVRDVRIEDIKV